VSKSSAGPRLAAVAGMGLAVGLIGLGVLSLIYRDFTLQWEPVPAGVHDRLTLALASGAEIVNVSRSFPQTESPALDVSIAGMPL